MRASVDEDKIVCLCQNLSTWITSAKRRRVELALCWASFAVESARSGLVDSARERKSPTIARYSDTRAGERSGVLRGGPKFGQCGSRERVGG